MRKLTTLVAVGVLFSGCSNREGTPSTLKSGKVVRLLFTGVVDNAFLSSIALTIL
jgi:hypothetical protein